MIKYDNKSKKNTCPECGRLLRNRCFSYNPIKDARLCIYCNKKLGRNKFYEPEIKGAKNRSLSRRKRFYAWMLLKDEREYLMDKKEKEGLTREEAKEKINNSMSFIRELIIKKQKENNIKPNNQQFLNRLKQGS
jgi:hypothetical protein